jgi:membrane-bound lytic murein transglycosylase B
MRHSVLSFLRRIKIQFILLPGILLLPQMVLAENHAMQTIRLMCKPPAPVKSGTKVKSGAKSRPSAKEDALAKKLAGFAAEMTNRHGFDPESLSCIFSQIRHNNTVIRLITPSPPGRPGNWQNYRDRFIEPVRIAAGATFWKQHEKSLERAEKEYGVPSEMIVGIIGIETTYGKNKGNFRVLDALATLAFDYPTHPRRDARMNLFRNELESVLLLSAELGINPLSLKGSYAGAIGWPQFLPSSIRAYAVDFDGDGKIDLIHSPVDAIGSVANFLLQHGWKKGEPTIFPAKLHENCPRAPETALSKGLVAKLTPDDLREICVTAQTALPDGIRFGLVNLQNGFEPPEYWLGTDNFFAITHYNRSYFYAMSVIALGHAVQALRNPD